MAAGRQDAPVCHDADQGDRAGIRPGTPDADVAAIQAQLGTPQEIAAAYVENMETAAVLKGLRIRRRVLFAVCVTTLAILISWVALVTIVTVRDRNSIGDAPYIEVYIE